MIKIIFGLYKKYTIWLAASFVIILIMMLAYVVYLSREQQIIDLFSFQQEVVSQQDASLIRETLDQCDKGMQLLSDKASQEAPQPDTRQMAFYDLYREAQDVIQAVIELDINDTIKTVYPERFSDILLGKRISNPDVGHSLKMLAGGKFSGGLDGLFGRMGMTEPWLMKSIGIGYPVTDRQGRYSGAVMALLSPQLIVKHSVIRNSIRIGECWLVDNEGNVVYHQQSRFLMNNLRTLIPNSRRKLEAQDVKHKYFIDNVIGEDGRAKACIVSYAPVKIGTETWWILLVVPYNKVHNLVANVSRNIILGAGALILVVLVTAVSIARSDVKRLRMKEELKRLKEREEWQGRLLREKMIIDGIIEGSPVPTFVIDKEHRVILWNRACTDLTGFNSKVMVGTGNYYQPFYNTRRPLIADFIVDRNIADFERYYGKGKVKKSEFIHGAYEAIKYFDNINGKGRHLHFIAAPIYDEKGEITSAIETFLDVTKEVELTKSLQEYTESLQNELNENIRLNRETEYLYNYLESIVDSLPERIFDLSSDGIINYISQKALKGRDVKSELKGKHFTEFVDPEHREYVISKWEDAQKGIFKPYELDVVTKRGEKRNLLITPSPVKGTGRFVLVQRDITELKDLEKRYYESQKLAAIGQLSAGIAHEVRNPLSSIKMSLQILEKRLQPLGNDLQRFRIAQREVEHLEKLVSDVLIYAKPLVPNREPSEIWSIIDSSLAMVEKPIREKHIEVRKNDSHKIPSISVDAAMMSQALINVLQNAIDAMEEKGTLEITIKEEHRSMVVEVSDNGCGIDEADMPHLFNLFFTRKNYGTGLGLSQVKKIIDQHGGEIRIVSVKGLSTRFIITLPIDDIEARNKNK